MAHIITPDTITVEFNRDEAAVTARSLYTRWKSASAPSQDSETAEELYRLLTQALHSA